MSRKDPIGTSAHGGGVQHFWMRKGAARLPSVARADGIYIWDGEGRRYLDATSGPLSVNLGHANRRVLDAMREQSERVCFAYPAYFESEDNIRLGDLLARLCGPGLDRSFFVSSGAEAMEKTLEFARLYAVARGDTARRKIISRRPAFHGSTLATQALSSDPGENLLGPLLQRWPKVDAPFSYRPAQGLDSEGNADRCAEQLRETILVEGPETVLAFVIEPVMGFSGGATHAPPSYYRRIREICDEFGILLIFDEVMSGAGRTGRFLAADWWPEARPDLVALAKGLGSGYHPVAAFVAPDAMVQAVVNDGGFLLGHTHKASPLACAVALAVLEETLDRDLIAMAARNGEYLRAQLRALQAEISIIGDVRGLGQMNAIEFVADPHTRSMLPRQLDVPADISRLGREHGLLLYARRTSGGRYGDWIMVAPPLIAEPPQIDEIVQLLRATLLAYQSQLRRDGHIT